MGEKRRPWGVAFLEKKPASNEEMKTPVPQPSEIAITTSSGHTVVDANDLVKQSDVQEFFSQVRKYRHLILVSGTSNHVKKRAMPDRAMKRAMRYRSEQKRP